MGADNLWGRGACVFAMASASCGPPEVENLTPSSVAYQPGDTETFSVALTSNLNSEVEVDLVANFAVVPMSSEPADPDMWTVQYNLPDCQLIVPYYYRVGYESNLPSEPDGPLTMREPAAGGYSLRRTSPSPPRCPQPEGLSLAVNTTADLVDANPGDGVCSTALGNCTLRAAIMEANASPGHDHVQLSAGTYVLSLDGDEDLDTPDDALGDLDILDGLDLVGVSAASTVIEADTGFQHRLLQVSSGLLDMVNVLRVTLRGGRQPDEPGGALYNEGVSTRLENAVLIDNRAFDAAFSCAANVGLEVCNRGGAIFNRGRLLVRRTTIRDNGTTLGGNSGHGGGIANFGPSARLFLDSSTIAENFARFVGGVQNVEGTIDAVNTTFYGNNPMSGWASAIYTTGGRVNLRHLTISESAPHPVFANSATIGAFSELRMESSIVHVDSGQGTLCTGPLESIRSNFVGDFDPDQDYIGGCDVSGLGPTVGSFSMGGLADNGGPTPTILVSEFSDLDIVDASSVVCPNRDQRGFSRTGDADGPAKLGCDPGAVEH